MAEALRNLRQSPVQARHPFHGKVEVAVESRRIRPENDPPMRMDNDNVAHPNRLTIPACVRLRSRSAWRQSEEKPVLADARRGARRVCRKNLWMALVDAANNRGLAGDSAAREHPAPDVTNARYVFLAGLSVCPGRGSNPHSLAAEGF